jgi:tyrosyl-tRNA synthetase
MADAFLQGFIKVFGSEIPAHYAEKINQVDVNASDKKPVKTLVDKTVIKPVRKRAKKSVKADTNDTDDTNDKNNNTSNDDISSLNKKNEMLIKIGKKK